MSLSPHARNALAALGDVEPTASDERRVREELERTLGVVLPVAAVTAGAMAASAAATSAASAATSAATGASVTGGSLFGLGVGAKVVLFVAAIGVGAVATVGVKTVVQSSTSRPPGAPSQPAVVALVKPKKEQAPVTPVAVPEPVAVAAPAPVVDEVEVEPAPEAPVVTSVAVAPKKTVRAVQPVAVVQPSAPVAEVTPNPAVETPDITPPPIDLRNAVTLENADSEMSFSMVVEAHFATCDPPTEGKTARAARKLLMDGRAEHALFLLGAYQKQCPSGHWSDEAWRVRLSSLCRLDRDSEAAGLFDWFVTEYPSRRAAIETELRATCSPQVLDTNP
ncbi:MAG: hypothetical protein U0228_35855 [Myxococcaceae bacterium]